MRAELGGTGDILFAVTTGEVENPLLNLTDVGVLASELAWDAVVNHPLSGVKAAK